MSLKTDYLEFDKQNKPSLKVTEADGKITDYEGLQALFNSKEYGEELRSKYPVLAQQIGTLYPNDPRNSTTYNMGRKLREIAYSPGKTFFGRIGDSGIPGGALMGSVAGLAAGIAGEKMTGNTLIPLITTAAGAAAGGAIGHGRKEMNKSAAMFRDPRNFILEKLQADHEVGMATKAQLAAAVRSLDPTKAGELASLVRAAVGYGVGSIIAKFVFGSESRLGSLFGGMLGASLFGTMLAPTPPSFFQPTTSYLDKL